MQENIKKIYRSNKKLFERHCYLFAIKAANSPEALVEALTEGIHHFEVKKFTGWVEVRVVLNNQMTVTKNEEKRRWQ